MFLSVAFPKAVGTSYKVLLSLCVVITISYKKSPLTLKCLFEFNIKWRTYFCNVFVFSLLSPVCSLPTEVS